MFKEIFLDVSELEAPEPFTEIIKLTKKLTRYSYLRIIHHREPFPLYSVLQENGFDFYTKKESGSEYTILIWVASDITTANYCKKLHPIELKK